MVGLKMCRRR